MESLSGSYQNEAPSTTAENGCEGGFSAVARLGPSTWDVAYIPFPMTEMFEGFPKLAAVKSVDNCSASAEQLRKEMKMGLLLKDCPSVVRLLGGDVTFALDHYRLLDNLFMELASGGTLVDLMEKNGRLRSTPVLEEWKVRRLTKSVVGGLARIHELGFAHHDVKLDNILLVKEANGGFTAKVADLGLAKKEKPGGKVRKVGGTVEYWSPEVVAESVQGRAADVWALGCTVFAMLTGKLPWDYVYGRRLSQWELMWAITEGPTELSLPAGEYTPWAEDFVEKCLRRDPSQRASAEDLLGHPFLAGEHHQVWLFDASSDDDDDIHHDDTLMCVLLFVCNIVIFIGKL